ncbi:L,D-transpeptidase LdtMt1, partial [Mycobacterium tuberculosis]
MRRVVRYLSVVVAITLMLTAESVSIATAAVPPLQPIPGVASVSPANGAVVGVAHPVVVTFTTPVTDRRAVERSIRISTPHNTTGHFEWVASNVVRWVPHRYWPPHTRVSVGVQELTEGFETGDALIGVASISAHTFTVSRNGEVLRTMPASLGKPSRPTPIGSFHA